jgi:cell division protein FtsI (penicillin-binding protein 3)
LYTYSRRFGFGQKTGIDFPGEIPGLLRQPAEWSKVSIGALAIGQEIFVTPIQLVTAFAAIANGGMLIKPYVVKQIREGEKIWQTFTPQVRARVISPEVSHTLRTILQGVVERGTGKLAAVEGYTAAGKTGTAQKVDPQTRAYSSRKLVVSFVGFLPVNYPQLVILVLLDEPQGPGIWGGTLAAPVFSRAAQQIMQYLKTPGQSTRVVWIDPESVPTPSFAAKQGEQEKRELSGISVENFPWEIARFMKVNWSLILQEYTSNREQTVQQ